MAFSDSDISSVQTRGIVKTSGFTSCIRRNWWFIEFHGAPHWNSSRTSAPEKIRTPTQSPERWTFLSLAFYNAPSIHTVDRMHFWGFWRLWGSVGGQGDGKGRHISSLPLLQLLMMQWPWASRRRSTESPVGSVALQRFASIIDSQSNQDFVCEAFSPTTLKCEMKIPHLVDFS